MRSSSWYTAHRRLGAHLVLDQSGRPATQPADMIAELADNLGEFTQDTKKRVPGRRIAHIPSSASSTIDAERQQRIHSEEEQAQPVGPPDQAQRQQGNHQSPEPIAPRF